MDGKSRYKRSATFWSQKEAVNEELVATEQENGYCTSTTARNPRSKSENRLRKSGNVAKQVTDRKAHYRKSAMVRSQTNRTGWDATEYGIDRFGSQLLREIFERDQRTQIGVPKCRVSRIDREEIFYSMSKRRTEMVTLSTTHRFRHRELNAPMQRRDCSANPRPNPEH